MPQHYLIFETAGGFCGIAWSEAGISRFQLPARRAEAAERQLRRRLPQAEPGEPPPAVAAAVAAVRRYFAGEPTDFAGLALDLGDQDRSSPGSTPPPAGSAGARRRPTARWRARSAPGPRRPATSARRWRRTRSRC